MPNSLNFGNCGSIVIHFSLERRCCSRLCSKRLFLTVTKQSNVTQTFAATNFWRAVRMGVGNKSRIKGNLKPTNVVTRHGYYLGCNTVTGHELCSFLHYPLHCNGPFVNNFGWLPPTKYKAAWLFLYEIFSRSPDVWPSNELQWTYKSPHLKCLLMKEQFLRRGQSRSLTIGLQDEYSQIDISGKSQDSEKRDFKHWPKMWIALVLNGNNHCLQGCDHKSWTLNAEICKTPGCLFFRMDQINFFPVSLPSTRLTWVNAIRKNIWILVLVH